jgi:hypothetical protein
VVIVDGTDPGDEALDLGIGADPFPVGAPALPELLFLAMGLLDTLSLPPGAARFLKATRMSERYRLHELHVNIPLFDNIRFQRQGPNNTMQFLERQRQISSDIFER